MGKLVDYKCEYGNYTGIDKDFVEGLGLKLPDMYLRGEDIAAYIKAVKEKNGDDYCKLPFDTALLAEAMGAKIQYDESPLGPRAEGITVTDPAEVTGLPEADLTSGRIAEMFRACDILREQGEEVLFEIRGLFDTLNSLMDIQNFIMFFMMNPKGAEDVCGKIKKEVLRFADEAKEHCDVMSYSDSSGGVNVLGPKMTKKVVKMFTYPLMKELEAILKGNTPLWLCPKISFMLTGTDHAEFCRMEVAEGLTYMEAVQHVPADVWLFGQTCNKHLYKDAKGHLDYIKLK